jgi:hypothetical protein
MGEAQTREEQIQQDEQPVLPIPQGSRPPEYWAERAEIAQEARALGLKLRRGKRLVFSSRRHLARYADSGRRSTRLSTRRGISGRSLYAAIKRSTAAV